MIGFKINIAYLIVSSSSSIETWVIISCVLSWASNESL